MTRSYPYAENSVEAVFWAIGHKKNSKKLLVVGGTSGMGLETARMVLKAGGSVVLFSASWCKPCQEMKPVFHALEEKLHSLAMIGRERPQAAIDTFRKWPLPLTRTPRTIAPVIGGYSPLSGLSSWLLIPLPEGGLGVEPLATSFHFWRGICKKT